MRNCLILGLLSLLAISQACSADEKPASPLETFKTYTKAIKKKDITTMKLLLSRETLKMHEEEARSQGMTVDDIVKRETLFTDSQTTLEYRNEKIDGEKATLEVKDSMGFWQTVHFVLENDEWKIDKKSTADQLMQEIEEENRKADEELNSNRPFDEPMRSPKPPLDVNSVSPTPTLHPLNANRASLDRSKEK